MCLPLTSLLAHGHKAPYTLKPYPVHCCCCSDNQLQTFNRKLESLKWDMTAWRSFAERKAGRDSQEAFQILNMDGGSAWELLTSLMQYEPNNRLSAAAALRHRWFGSSLLAPVGAALDKVATSVGQVCNMSCALFAMEYPSPCWESVVVDMSACCFLPSLGFCLHAMYGVCMRHGHAALQNLQGSSWGNQREAGLTESQIREELQNSGTDEIPLSVRNASNTVAWWRSRQAVIDLKVCD